VSTFDDLWLNAEPQGRSLFDSLFDESPQEENEIASAFDSLFDSPLAEKAEQVDTDWSLNPVDAARSLGAGLAGLPSKVLGASNFVTELPIHPKAMAEGLLGAVGLDLSDQRAQEREALGRVRSLFDDLAGSVRPPEATFSEAPFQAVANAVGESAPSTLLAMAAGPAAVPAAFALEGGAVYDEARSRGVSEGKALAAGAGVGLVNAFLEKAGINSILGKSGPGVTRILAKFPALSKPAQAASLQKVAVAAAGEGLTEVSQELVGIAGELATGASIDGRQAFDRTMTSLFAGGVAGGALNRVADVASGRGADVAALAERELTVRGGLPDYAFDAKEASDQAIRADQVEAGHLAEDFNVARDLALREDGSLDFDALQSDSFDYLIGSGDGASLPAPVRDSLDELRVKQDALSSSILEADGLVSSSLRETIEGNLGSYLRRSFKVHDDPGHLEKVRGTPEWEAARAYLAESNSDLDEAGVVGVMEEIASGGVDLFSPQGGSLLGTIDRTGFRQRKDMPQEILDLMGEYRDPAAAFMHSTERASRALHRHEMFSAIREGGLGVDFFESPTAGSFTQVPGADSRAPLGGMYTSQNMAKALSNSLDASSSSLFGMINGTVKLGLTVGSIQAQARNAESNLLSLAANGNLASPYSPWAESRADGARGLARGYRVASSGVGLSGRMDKELRGEYLDAVRLGVVGGNVDLGDTSFFLGLDSGFKPRSTVGQVASVPLKTYAINDDAFKVQAFRSEARKYEWATGDKESSRAIAAGIVKGTMQNYNRLPKVVDRIRRTPVIGPFVSFPASVLINTKNTLAQAFSEVGSENGRIRTIGAHRLGGLAAAYSVPAAVALGVKAATGGDLALDDEEADAFQNFLPFYLEASQYVVTGKEPGKVQIADLSFIDYYATVKDPVIASIRAGAVDENAFSSALLEAAQPFIGEEVVAGTLLDVARNHTSNGYPVYSEGAPLGAKIDDVAGYIWKNLRPGTIKTASRIKHGLAGTIDADGRSYELAPELLAVAGPRMYTLDIGRKLTSKGYAFGDAKREAASGVRKSLSRGASLGPREVQRAVDESYREILSAYESMEREYRAAIVLGVGEDAAVASLKESKLSATDLGVIQEGLAVSAASYWMRTRLDKVNDELARRQSLELAEWKRSNPFATPVQVAERTKVLAQRWSPIENNY
jgi:hypothetical protein